MNIEKQKALQKQLRIIKAGLEQTNELIETLILTVDKITDEQVKELVSSCSLLDFLADKFKAKYGENDGEM